MINIFHCLMLWSQRWHWDLS